MATAESTQPRETAAKPPSTTVEVVRIRPSKGWRALDLRELWRYRELLWFLALRDVKLRYKQTALGAAWAVIQPLFTMLVFSLFFGRLAGIPSDGVPYPLFALCGPPAVAALRLRPDAVEQQRRQRTAADYEGLLPATARAVVVGPVRTGRFRHRFRAVAGADGLVCLGRRLHGRAGWRC